LVQQFVDRIVTVRERDLQSALAGLVESEHLVAEGAGAAAIAALFGSLDEVRGRRVAAIVTGSNIDRARLAAILRQDKR
jgi:threonine dehydratase